MKTALLVSALIAFSYADSLYFFDSNEPLKVSPYALIKEIKQKKGYPLELNKDLVSKEISVIEIEKETKPSAKKVKKITEKVKIPEKTVVKIEKQPVIKKEVVILKKPQKENVKAETKKRILTDEERYLLMCRHLNKVKELASSIKSPFFDKEFFLEQLDLMLKGLKEYVKRP